MFEGMRLCYKAVLERLIYCLTGICWILQTCQRTSLTRALFTHAFPVFQVICRFIGCIKELPLG
ncbi:hypothetical protein Mapa_004930 [Marchantia paleacea]|nr:hypothetical protein Mapa_004930 [Marchantia paleacea]